MSANLPIKAVSKETGLSPHTIRAWERRYGALSPDRSESNRRLYSRADVERLQLLKAAVDQGHSISQVVGLANEELLQISGGRIPKRHVVQRGQIAEQCIAAVHRMDSRELESIMLRGMTGMGAETFVLEVVVPVITFLDEGWNQGSTRIRQEHLASATIRSVLDRVRLSFQSDERAPKLLITTPARQLHELGALLVCIIAAVNGWHPIYLGANLPAAEIAAAAIETRAKAIALSIVYPTHDPELADELLELRRRLPRDVSLIVGGRAAKEYDEVIRKIKGILVGDITGMPRALEEVAA